MLEVAENTFCIDLLSSSSTFIILARRALSSGKEYAGSCLDLGCLNTGKFQTREAGNINNNFPRCSIESVN